MVFWAASLKPASLKTTRPASVSKTGREGGGGEGVSSVVFFEDFLKQPLTRPASFKRYWLFIENRRGRKNGVIANNR